MFKVFDLHNDFYLKLNTNEKKDKYVLKCESFAENIVSAIWTSELNETESFSAINRAKEYVNLSHSLFLAVEDLHFLSKENLNQFVKTMPIYAGLTWNRTNCVAGGVYESGGLTSFGKKVIKEFEKNNIVIDTAHLNEESFADVLKFSSKSLVCSHTAFFGKNKHKRNLKDYQIKEIVSRGGIVGLCFVSEFLNGSNKSTIEDVVAHIDYFACKFGILNLAIGTDFYGTEKLPKNLKSYSNITKLLSEKLLSMGYTEKSINKIFFENANNFFY